MELPPHEAQTLSSYLEFDNKVDYGSDTSVWGQEGTMSNKSVPDAKPYTELIRTPNVAKPTRQWRSIIQRILRIPSALLARWALVSDHLAYKSVLHRSNAKRVLKRHCGYVFTTSDVEEHLRQTMGLSLPIFDIYSNATSFEDIAFRQKLQDRYLEPYFSTQGQHKAHLWENLLVSRFDRLRACPYSCLLVNCPKRKTTSSFAKCIESETVVLWWIWEQVPMWRTFV